MRTSRLAATAALFVITSGALVSGATGAFAAPSPSATSSATPSAAATGTPSADPTATGTPSATTTPSATAPPTGTPTTTPSATVPPTGTPSGTPTATTTPTGTPSATATLPEGCMYQRDVKMPVHTTASSVTLVQGGAAQEVAVSFQNTSSTTLTDFKLSYKIDGVKGLWLPKSLVKVQNGAWKPADPAPGTHDSVPLGSFQVKANEMITVVIRLSPEGTMPTLYNLSLTGASEVLPYGVGPENVKYTCNRLTGSFAADVRVRRPGGATGTPTATAEPSATGTPTESASPTATATTAAPSTTTSTGPRTTGTTGTGTTGSTGTTGTRLAETGASSSTLPLAITGGVAIALGAASVLVARRRKAARD